MRGVKGEPFTSRREGRRGRGRGGEEKEEEKKDGGGEEDKEEEVWYTTPTTTTGRTRALACLCRV
jgi:hypothetical protein